MSDLLIRRRNLLLRKQEEEMNIRAVCFKADGEQTVAITKVGSAPAITMQYSYDGVTWDAWDLSALPFGGSTKVYVRGVGNARFGADNNNHNRITFGTGAYVYVSGIVESLLDGENERLTLSARGALRQLFYQQTAIRSAEDLRFEAQNASHTAYALMFRDCTNLIYAPKRISATILSDTACCGYMFYGCKSLLTAPELPATKLGNYCYQYMFYDCTSLVNAPKLNAASLPAFCCEYMFRGCTSLMTAPELPAEAVGESCYRAMFAFCTSLVTAPELPATKLGYSPYRDMFHGCTSLIKAPSILPVTTIGSWAYCAMFFGCTSLEDAPELPAETLADNCYRSMFNGCKSLKTIRCHAKATAKDVTYQWLKGVAATGTFYGHSEYGWSSGMSGIPSGWTFVELTD